MPLLGHSPQSGLNPDLRLANRSRALFLDHIVDDLIERGTRAIANEFLELVDARHATLHILETEAIDFVIGLLDDLGGRASAFLDTLGKAVNGDFLVIADVEDLTNRIGRVEQTGQ